MWVCNVCGYVMYVGMLSYVLCGVGTITVAFKGNFH